MDEFDMSKFFKSRKEVGECLSVLDEFLQQNSKDERADSVKILRDKLDYMEMVW